MSCIFDGHAVINYILSRDIENHFHVRILLTKAVLDCLCDVIKKSAAEAVCRVLLRNKKYLDKFMSAICHKTSHS